MSVLCFVDCVVVCADRGRDSFVFKDAERLPTCKGMEKSRLATFKVETPWPHDAVKGHGASSSKVRALYIP